MRTWLRSLQEAQRLSPDVFGSVHPEATRRWKHSRTHGCSYKTWPASTVRQRHLHALPMCAHRPASVLCPWVQLGTHNSVRIFLGPPMHHNKWLRVPMVITYMCEKVPTVITLSVSAGFSVLQCSVFNLMMTTVEQRNIAHGHCCVVAR